MATIDGTSASETLVGGSDSDLINGYAGNDTITGDGGNDTMYGGTGNDYFRIGGTSFGTDIFNGGDGADAIYLTADVTVSQLLLDSAHVISTETLDFNYSDISGTGGNDVFDISGIITVNGYRRMYLQDGNDRFTGYQGNDNVDGGAGVDTLIGNSGSDTLIGGGGNDSMLGGSGNDYFFIGGTDTGTDIYNGGDGADTIYLTSDINTSRLQLSSANVISTETLDFNYSDISGTGGGDIFDISGITTVNGYRRMYLQDGNDRFTGYQGNDNVDGGAGNDTLIGNSGSDTLIGSGGNDQLLGMSGNDYFYIGGNDFGSDTYIGGEGQDIIYLTSDITTSQFLLTSANVISAETLDFNYSDISGTGGNDVFSISGITSVIGYRIIYLQDGADSFTGYLGNDYVDGGSGNDTLLGGAGNDTLIGGSGNDVLNGGTGNDYFYIGGNDFGSDRYVGYDGSDTIYMTSDINVSRFVLTSGNMIGIESLDFAYRDLGGTGGNDFFDISGIQYTYSYRWIELQDGNDYFRGYQGSDYVDGGAGNDTLIGGAGNDSLRGGSGTDTVTYATSRSGIRVDLSLTTSQALGGNEGADTLESIENVIGSNYSDRITGNASANLLVGYGGNDTLEGGAGNDTLNGGTGLDTVVYTSANAGVIVNLNQTSAQNVGGGMGIDLLVGIEHVTGSNYDDRLLGSGGANILNAGNRNDVVIGAAGNDVLYGGTGNDTLDGGTGNDVLWGQAGNDILTGGTGADQFVFQAGYGSDQIRGWENGSDHIVIRGGTTYDEFSDLTIRSVGGHAVVSFGGTSITLVGVSVAQVDASDFQFV
ncbi:beta strand repeat-containing protein [Paracoccus lutimaris]|uniref:Hemolysin type calcium-binding protein n=1 Tax=Paracoccus lutimaris TaxID=1490030 RepID=A0A368YNE8_9RHOB|nr:calcium-binding protein [Paracoccus lutimaris]RCW80816.1 hemolysin type calcium-binding protein [Paracoccus lutimaris]